MTITLRPLDLATDCFRMAALQNAVNAQQTTGEILRQEEQSQPPGTIYQMLAAVDETGYLVGYCAAWHRPWMPEGRFRVLVYVDQAYRRQGIGSRLYAAAHRFMLDHGATHLGCSVRDDQPAWLRFARACGYEIERQTFTSRLDFTDFDVARWAGIVETVAARGIRFRTLADLGNTEQAQYRLYELNRTLGLQTPGADSFPDWDDFRTHVFRAHWFRPEGQILALDGEQWVGLGAVGIHPASAVAANNFTGVAASHRGRGIAQALKVLGITWARQQGVPAIRTDNDSLNTPMLAINRKLGYRPEPGHYMLVQTVPAR